MITTKRNMKLKTTINSTIERHPVPVLGINYKVRIVYKNIGITELDIENKTIKISLPNKYKKMGSKEILDLAIEKMYEQIAKVEIERAMEKARITLGFAPEDYKIEKIKSWGKCEENTIIINPEIVMYNRKIVDYVVLHQYCHLKYKTHAKSFWNMLKKYEPLYKEYEETLAI